MIFQTGQQSENSAEIVKSNNPESHSTPVSKIVAQLCSNSVIIFVFDIIMHIFSILFSENIAIKKLPPDPIIFSMFRHLHQTILLYNNVEKNC